jgi:hypothetical protein
MDISDHSNKRNRKRSKHRHSRKEHRASTAEQKVKDDDVVVAHRFEEQTYSIVKMPQTKRKSNDGGNMQQPSLKITIKKQDGANSTVIHSEQSDDTDDLAPSRSKNHINAPSCSDNPVHREHVQNTETVGSADELSPTLDHMPVIQPKVNVHIKETDVVGTTTGPMNPLLDKVSDNQDCAVDLMQNACY